MSLTDQRHVGPVFRQETGGGSGTATSEKPAGTRPVYVQQQQEPRHSPAELRIIQQQQQAQQRQL